MKYKLYKILFAIFFALISLIFGLLFRANPASAIDTLIRPYPTIGGLTIAFGMTLPELIKYIYLFAMGISGAVALTSMLIGAIRYISAAGNPSKMSDARDQIFSALLGVVILLSSYLILNTINPDLVNFTINTSGLNVPDITANRTTTTGPTYSCLCCCSVSTMANTIECTEYKAPAQFTTCLPFSSLYAANLYCAQRCMCPGGMARTRTALCSQ